MTSESLAPSVVARIMSEIRTLVKSPMEGIEYDEDDNTISEIHALITGVNRTFLPFLDLLFITCKYVLYVNGIARGNSLPQWEVQVEAHSE